MSALPHAFAHLEPYVDWALRSETERNRRRLASSQAAIMDFAQAVLASAADIAAYIDALPKVERGSEENERLLCLLLSLAEVAPAVEFYHQPAVVDGYDSARFAAQETHKLRPDL